MRSLTVLVATCVLTVPLNAQTQEKKASAAASGPVRYLNPLGLAQNPRYSQAVEITGGQTILISGQVAYDKDGNVVGKDDFRAQVKQVFENLRNCARRNGRDFQ